VPVGGRRRRGVSGARRGNLGGASCRRRLGGASARDGTSNDGLWRASDGGVLAVPWRKVLMMATVMVPPQAIEHVYGIEEMVATLDAGVGLQGRTRATAHARALARPGRCLGALTACLARSGRVWARVFRPMACKVRARDGTSRFSEVWAT
jgi:hypothetical protein